jgi:hypothetical protein
VRGSRRAEIALAVGVPLVAVVAYAVFWILGW